MKNLEVVSIHYIGYLTVGFPTLNYEFVVVQYNFIKYCSIMSERGKVNDVPSQIPYTANLSQFF